jgi:hypothetical protein
VPGAHGIGCFDLWVRVRVRVRMRERMGVRGVRRARGYKIMVRARVE